MPKIVIQYTRKVTFHKIVDVTKKEAERLLALNEEDLSEYRDRQDDTDDFQYIAETLTDMHDVYDSEGELENLSITKYKPKK